jgi:predicted amidohydrolase YtcJ
LFRLFGMRWIAQLSLLTSAALDVIPVAREAAEDRGAFRQRRNDRRTIGGEDIKAHRQPDPGVRRRADDGVAGFIDAHNHALGAILLYEVPGTPYEVEFVTIASIVDKLRAKARETPAGFWVEGYFFDDTKVKDKGVLDIRDLDQVSSEHPVAVRHRGGHTSYCNSKALALAGVTRNTPTRPRGRSFATPMANSTAG